MEKTDLTKIYKRYYTAAKKPELIDVEQARYIAVHGKGDPSGELFALCVEALYTVAYTIKFAGKAEGNDFTVAKLEGLWSFDESKYNKVSATDAPVQVPRSEWNYRLLIRMPDHITSMHLDRAVKTAFEKKQKKEINKVEWFEMEAHKAVQMLHTGSFDKEPETLALIGEFMEQAKLVKKGAHHEIYLSDFRKTSPEKLRTILREPV